MPLTLPLESMVADAVPVCLLPSALVCDMPPVAPSPFSPRLTPPNVDVWPVLMGLPAGSVPWKVSVVRSPPRLRLPSGLSVRLPAVLTAVDSSPVVLVTIFSPPTDATLPPPTPNVPPRAVFVVVSPVVASSSMTISPAMPGPSLVDVMSVRVRRSGAAASAAVVTGGAGAGGVGAVAGTGVEAGPLVVALVVVDPVVVAATGAAAATAAVSPVAPGGVPVVGAAGVAGSTSPG